MSDDANRKKASMGWNMPKSWLIKSLPFVFIILLIAYRRTSQDHLSHLNNILLLDGSTSARFSSSLDNSKLVINTTGCQLEYIAPFDDRYPETKSFFHRNEPLNCQLDIPPLSILQDGVLKVNSDVLSKYYSAVKQCSYKSLGRDKNDPNWVLFGTEKKLDLNVKTKVNDGDFILVECTSANGTVLYRDLHQQIVKKLNWEGQPFPKKSTDDYSLILVVLESTSRSSWLRQCPDAAMYLNESLGGVLFSGHNKVADNTAVNLYPMVTGRHLAEDWKNLLLSSVDDFPWIWKEAERKGYVTQIAEEASGLNRPKWIKDFNGDPAYHFHRPAREYKLKERTIPHNPQGNVCFGSKSTLKSLFDWVLEFQLKYKENKRVSALVMSTPLLSHDDVNGLNSKEHIFLEFFKNLNVHGLVNDTFLIVVGDHGLRVGDYYNTKAGAYEARLPMLTVVTPRTFKEKYPEAHSNLVFNANNRLTSHFDIWRTFKYMLNKEYLKTSSPSETSKHGISLMQPIPAERDCDGAGIPAHWCACGSYVNMAKDDQRARKAGEILINSINSKMSVVHDFCLEYRDFSITEAKLKVPSYDVELVITTNPESAVFRSSIRLEESQPVINAIERLDMYGAKSLCISEHKSVDMVLLKLCICKDWSNH